MQRISKCPSSCDTFVVLPPGTPPNCVIFGKNSDRPAGEVQEIIYQPAEDHDGGSEVQCTYIKIEQSSHTLAVILSKPAWMWGAEMGANEKGVCIGNEAVFTKLNGPDDEVERLLGMDLVRLGLERGSTAAEALDVVVSLLEKYGQGGQCSDVMSFTYHNSFLIADPQEAWVLETAGKLWAAERIGSGCRNISNCLSIGTQIDKSSEGLQDKAKELALWDGQGEFNFSEVFGSSDSSGNERYTCGKQLLEKYSANGDFSLQHMMQVLRDEPSGICMSDGSFVSASSQVSVLSAVPDHPSCHWFTGTPDPRRSVFKPFIFSPKVRISPHIQSPRYSENEDPAKVVPRFQKKVNRAHALYKFHQSATRSSEGVLRTLQTMEAKCVEDVEKFLSTYTPAQLSEVDDLFKDVVETEYKFYKFSWFGKL